MATSGYDIIILDSKQLVRQFRTALSFHNEGKELFDLVTNEIFDYFGEFEYAKNSIDQYVLDIRDTFSEDPDQDRIAELVFTYAMKLWEMVYYLDVLDIHGIFWYSFFELIGDDIVLARVEENVINKYYKTER